MTPLTKQQIIDALSQSRPRPASLGPTAAGRAPAFGEDSLSMSMVPTTRHDDGPSAHGGYSVDERVRDTAMFFMGSLNPAQRKQVYESVKHFHDHKGHLFLLHEVQLEESIYEALEKAWEYVGGEYDVEFVTEHSPNWIDVWARRRF